MRILWITEKKFRLTRIIMLGKPVIKGTRITVELVLTKLSEGMTTNEILEAYPHLNKDDIMACLSYSANVISREEMIVS